MKRFSLGLAALSCAASLTTYAALPTDAAPFQVNIPNLSPGIEVGFTAYALRPSATESEYAITGTSPTTVVDTDPNTVTYNVDSVDPDYEWAFAIMVGYIFPCSGNDVRVSWIHFDQSETDSTSVTQPPAGSTVFDIIGPVWDFDFSDIFPSNFTSATGTEDFEYDAVDLTVGQYVNLGTRLQTRLFAGLRWARIQDDLDVTFTGSSTSTAGAPVTASSLIEDYDSKFDGIGALFGFDSTYHLGYCFGLVAHADIALLVGEEEASATFTTFDFVPSETTTTGTNVTTVTSDDVTRVVPGFDARLGLDWTYPFTYGCNCTDGEFSIEAGYQWTYYVNAVDRIQVGDETTATDSEPLQFDSFEREAISVGFDGPYVSVTLKI